MKKVYSKICNSKLLFTVFILTCFILFDFLTTGLGIWGGLVEKLSIVFNNIYSYTYYGKEFISEMIWLLLLIPVVIIFKNKYIFRQKRMKLLPSLLIAWPFVLYTLIAMIRSFVSVNISRINIYEIIALVLFTLTIGLFEEIMCRGWLQNEFIERFGHDRKGVIYSIIVSGTIFGLMHITNLFFGQDLFNTVIQVISASVTGIAFGAIYHRTKNIWSVIVLHGVWDFAIFFAEINIATSCVTASSSIDVITPVLGILAVILSIFTSLPELFIALTLMSKSSINLGLDENYRIALTDEQIKADKSKEKVFSIITGCLLFIYAIGVLIWGGAVSDTCPNYILKDVSNYSEVLLNYDNYDLIVEMDLCQVFRHIFLKDV